LKYADKTIAYALFGRLVADDLAAIQWRLLHHKISAIALQHIG
jgi:hypothetical protein